MGETLERFNALALDEKHAAFVRLRTTRVASENSVRRAIAYAVAEVRRLENQISFDDLTAKLNGLVAFGVDGESEGEFEIDAKNLANFIGRTTERPDEDILGLCALYVWEYLEGKDAVKLEPLLLPGQLRLMEWARDLLRSGKAPTQAPIADVGEPKIIVDPSLVFGLTQAQFRQVVHKRVEGALDDGELRSRIIGPDPDIHQAGFVCFRSAYKKPRTIVQSYLTILAPEKSKTPFWTFAHIYVREGQSKDVRYAGGLVVTTFKALYLVGVEGWMKKEHVGAESGIRDHLKARTVTMFAIPLETIGVKSPIQHGIAMCSNADDRPVVGRVALHRTNASSHAGLVGLVEVETFRANMQGLVDRRVIDLELEQTEAESEEGHAERIAARITARTNDILTATNNGPDWQFLGATPKDGGGKGRSHNNLKSDIEKIFSEGGDPLFKAPDGTDYRFDVHQWFNALSWR